MIPNRHRPGSMNKFRYFLFHDKNLKDYDSISAGKIVLSKVTEIP